MISKLIAQLPDRYYLRMGMEIDPDDQTPFLSAAIMEVPPEEGWTIPTYFDEPPGVKRAHTEEWLEPYRHEDVARVGIAGDPEDQELFERLLETMLTRFLTEKGA